MTKKAFFSKKIYTAITPELIDGCIVIDGNRISFVGNEADAKKYIDERTEVFALADKFIMPGFNDFHVHLLPGAMMEHDGILRYADSEEEAAKMLYDANKGKAEQEWILGGAWDHFRWEGHKEPNKKSLDKYFPDKKVFSLNKECHSAWVNSKTLEFFNITRETKDPENGFYGRDANGEPNGYVHEKACANILNYIFDNLSDAQGAEYVKAYAAKAGSLGITSVGDVPVGSSVKENAYRILEQSNELTMRIHFAKLMMTDIDELLRIKKTFDGEKLRFIGVKDFIDGTPMGHSGYMLEEYSDKAGFTSSPMIPQDILKTRVNQMAENGMKVRLHACGDAGVRLCLDAFEETMNKLGDKGLRHCVEHIESTTAEDIIRFGPLGVVASVQPEHMPKYDFFNHPFHSMIGDERMKFSWPFESLRSAGAVLAYGTDFPVADMSPFRGIYRSVSRLTNDGEPEGGFNPWEKMGIHESLRAYTYGGAYAANREDIGTLKEGNLADLVVLDEDLFQCAYDREKMFNIKPIMTIMDGNIVFKR